MKSPHHLSQVLDNRSWLRCGWPFPHVTGQSVFTPDYYKKLAGAFWQILGAGTAERPRRCHLSRSMPGYDAYGMTFPPDYEGPFSLFMSRQWHDMLSALFDVACTGHINCGIHHHSPGSASGWVHNDLNPAYFVDYPSDDGINVVRHDVCSYAFGKTRRQGVQRHMLVRRIAMLFYLCNPPWFSADGGSTGLYACKDDPVDCPAKTLPPINNSILLFECTPYSFHTFLSNRSNSRNSIIMWLHGEPEEIISRWGWEKVVQWPTPNP